MTPLNIAVIGAGYWGRNHVRNLAVLAGSKLSWVCDLDENARQRAQQMAPKARVTANYEEVLADAEVKAVVVASNAIYHHQHVMAALRAGKHVLVEKPLALSVDHAEEMVALARERQLTLMVGHLLVYHSAVDKLAQIIRSGDLGEIYYLYAVRVNLGRVRHDENALWNFAPHDLSILLHLLGEAPATVWARGECYLQPNIEDVVFVNLQFPNRRMAQIQLSWLDPRKERSLTVVGSKKMVIFDDAHATEKIRIFDKGVDRAPEYNSYSEYLSLREGDIHIPHLELNEPLMVECKHFIDCVTRGQKPLTDGESGLTVVRILAAADKSLKSGGVPITLG